MTFPLPEAAVASHTAVLGKTGSGKTSTAKLIVEHAVDEGHRVCVLDPLKSDWWGLTSSASGKRAGLPFTILGGPRMHVPLNPTAGKLVGELVATGKLPLSILDMSAFRAGEHQRFFIEFADALMRKMQGVLYLVMEEAHEFAPKERSGIGNENMAIYAAKKLATAGRSKGIRLVLATQRVQALHNSLLGSCETMVVHRMTAPADQEPVKKWLKGNVEKEVAAEIDAGMARLPTGTAWVCSGEAAFHRLVKFPLFRTFDNSRAPKRGDGVRDVTTAAVDHDALRDMLGQAVAEAEANDPAKLRARVAELEKRLRDRAEEPVTVLDPKVIAEAERKAFSAGSMDSRIKIAVKLRELVAKIEGASPVLIHKDSAPIQIVEKTLNTLPPAPHKTQVTVRPQSHKERIAIARGHAPSPDGLQPAHVKVLEGLAMLRGIGMTTPRKSVLGATTGYSHKGGGFARVLSHLSSAGLIQYVAGGVELTASGLDAAPAVEGGSIRTRLRALTQPAHERVLDALTTAGGSLSKQQLADATGYEAKGGGFARVLSHLSSLEVISYARGDVVLAEWVS